MAASLRFTVQRRPAVLVVPAAPTPRELKRLSDIDDKDSHRLHVPLIFFYRRLRESAAGGGRDPVTVIRDAVSRALVHYYPFAGRLRELEEGKLAVDCTGEGVLFVEADADVCLQHFGGDALLPPFPCVEELIFDVPGSSAILDAPLGLFQVTRLACGGFVLAVRLNHTMADALGMAQFLGAVAELAWGAQAPMVRPVWERELLEARGPPPPGFAHRMLDEAPDTKGTMGILLSGGDMANRYFFFGPREVAAMRAQLAPHLQKRVSKIDIISGCLWKWRTVALSPRPEEEMRMLCLVSARGRGPAGIPSGYYGNACAAPAAISTAAELCTNPLSYAVDLVKKAKDEVDMEYMRSMASVLALRRRSPRVTVRVRTFVVSDVTKARFHEIDFGWGRPVYGGAANAVGSVNLPWMASFLLPFTNSDGEDGSLVQMFLPIPAMDRFVEEMGKLLRPLPDVAALHKPEDTIRRSAL